MQVPWEFICLAYCVVWTSIYYKDEVIHRSYTASLFVGPSVRALTLITLILFYRFNVFKLGGQVKRTPRGCRGLENVTCWLMDKKNIFKNFMKGHLSRLTFNQGNTSQIRKVEKVTCCFIMANLFIVHFDREFKID